MLISEVTFNPSERAACYLFDNRQRVHAALVACVPYGDKSPHPLWQVNGNRMRVVSIDGTELTPLTKELGRAARVMSQRNYDEMIDRIDLGDELMFEITMSRSRSEDNRSNRRGPRSSIRSEDQAIDYLVSGKEEKTGLAMRDVVSIGQTREHITNHDKAGKETKFFVPTISLCGSATVTDPIALRAALTTGIGRHRAYGCGLLSVTRA